MQSERPWGYAFLAAEQPAMLQVDAEDAEDAAKAEDVAEVDQRVTEADEVTGYGRYDERIVVEVQMVHQEEVPVLDLARDVGVLDDCTGCWSDVHHLVLEVILEAILEAVEVQKHTVRCMLRVPVLQMEPVVDEECWGS